MKEGPPASRPRTVDPAFVLEHTAATSTNNHVLRATKQVTISDRNATNLRKLQRIADNALRAGNLDDALPAYQQLLALDPNRADAWYNMGYLQRRRGDFEAALNAYRQALQHGVPAPEEVHLNCAAILSDHLYRDDEAEQALQQALSVAPGYLPAWTNLGNLHEARGRRNQAIGCYRRILAKPSTHPRERELQLESLARLAELHPDGPTGELTQRLAGEANDARLSPTTQANLLFALGRLHQRNHDYDAAFAAFSRANQQAHRDTPAYSSERAASAIDALIEAFDRPNADSRPGEPTPATQIHAPQPVFICGMFRSGSTLLERILDAHADVTSAGELDLLPRIVRGPLSPFPARIKITSRAQKQLLAQHYMAEVIKRIPDAAKYRYFTDKRPDNFLLAGLVKQLFPHAKIINTVRNPLDNGLSIFMQHLNPRAFPYAGDLASIGRHYVHYRRLMDHWKSLYPDSILDFDYDAFVANPRSQLAPLLTFLGLPYDEHCLHFHQHAGAVRTASQWQVREPLHSRASGRWQHYPQHLAPLRDALGSFADFADRHTGA